MLRVIAVSSGAVDYLLRGSGCAGHEHAPDLDAEHSAPCRSTQRRAARARRGWDGALLRRRRWRTGSRWAGGAVAGWGCSASPRGRRRRRASCGRCSGSCRTRAPGSRWGRRRAGSRPPRSGSRRRWRRSRTPPRSGAGSSSWPRPPMAARRWPTTTSPSPHPSRCRCITRPCWPPVTSRPPRRSPPRMTGRWRRRWRMRRSTSATPAPGFTAAPATAARWAGTRPGRG